MSHLILSLRAGAKVYLNGAVIRVDRKVNLELMNDVTFLLESHVLQADEATTPTRQLYFVLQTMLMDPTSASTVRPMFDAMLVSTKACFDAPEAIAGLEQVRASIEAGRLFEGLKQLRKVTKIEDAILAVTREPATSPTQAA